jgi:REP element-mobilizing transposase RayT
MSYTSILFHCIFATKERRPWISKEIRPRLWAYMGGIARSNGMRALAIGGVQDHVHLLLSLHPCYAYCQSHATNQGRLFQMVP